MSLPAWREEPIAKHHNRAAFNCGEPELNEYLQRHARQSHERGGAKTYVAVDELNSNTVLGFYSLCPASLEYEQTPVIIKKGLARHDVPVFRLGRLAVDIKLHGHGLGGQLLLAAGRRCLYVAAQTGGVAMLIDAKSEKVAEWYASYGAVPLVDSTLSLLLPLKTIHAALHAAGHV